ncbi:MAG: hypothetical protein PHS45_03725 [Bacilli bacterium]|nr:hypothetical protein [Bacilli bacterium]
MKKNVDKNEIFDLGKILIILIAIFMIIYLLTMVMTGEIKKRDKTPDSKPRVYIQYNEIIAGEIFNRPENEYYVIFYDYNGKEAALINDVVDKHMSKESNIKVYKVNLASGFNTLIYDEDNINIETNKLEELKVNDTLLIKIKDKENILQVTDIAEIFAKLK